VDPGAASRSQRARQMPQTQVVVCGDRESDVYELYDQIQAAPGTSTCWCAANMIVVKRREPADGVPASVAAGGLLSVKVPRREGRPARTATLELRWKEVELQPPRWR